MKPGSEDGNKLEAVREETMEIAMAVAEVKEAMVTAVEMLEYLGSDSRVERAAAVHFFSQELAGDEKGPLPLHSPGRLPGLVQLLADCVSEMSHHFQNKTILSINRLVYHFARILEPTETEMTNLEDAVKAVDCYIKINLPSMKEKDYRPISQVLPIIMDIFQEPGNRKKAQIQEVSCLAYLAANGGYKTRLLLNESGAMGVMMETVRVGKASPDVLTFGIWTIHSLIQQADHDLAQSALDSGILEVIEEVFKRPNHNQNDPFTPNTWLMAMKCLLTLCTWSQEQALDAILSSGLMERMLEMGLGMPSEDRDKPYYVLALMGKIGTEGQMRRLMSIGIFFRFLAAHLNVDSGRRSSEFSKCLTLVKACLKVPGTEQELRIRRRLFDDSGITDAIRRISLNYRDPNCYGARDIFNTYLKDPLRPRPPFKLPAIIYTKNAPQ